MTVYPVKYRQKLFDAINDVTFRWMKCGFIWLAMLQFETGLQKGIRMGITLYKIFIWGGISSDIHSEIKVYSSAQAHGHKIKFSTVYPTIYLPKRKFEFSRPLILLEINLKLYPHI